MRRDSLTQVKVESIVLEEGLPYPGQSRVHNSGGRTPGLDERVQNVLLPVDKHHTTQLYRETVEVMPAVKKSYEKKLSTGNLLSGLLNSDTAECVMRTAGSFGAKQTLTQLLHES